MKITQRKENTMVDFNALLQKRKIVMIGNVKVKGSELISKRMFELLTHILSLQNDFGIKTIEFCTDKVLDDKGEELLGCAYPETDSIKINLPKHVDSALNKCVGKGYDMSFSAYIWHNTLQTICHEVFHIWSRNSADNKMDEIEGEEEMARDWAMATVIEMAKKISIEPVSPEEQPFFGPKILEFRDLLDNADPNDENLKQQRYMFDNGLVWSDENMNIFTLKELYRIISDDHDSDEWKAEENAIRFVEKGTAKTVEAPTPPVEKPAIEEATPTPPEENTIPIDDAGYYNDEDIDPEYGYASGPILDVDQEEQILLRPGVSEKPACRPAPPTVDDLPAETKVSMAFGKLPAPPPPAAPVGAMTAPVPNTNSDLSMEEITQIVKTVFGRLYCHIFTKCGYQLDGYPIPSAAKEPFNNPFAVLDPVFINDINGAEKIFKTMDTQDANGKWAPGTIITGSIKGQVFKKSGLPGYILYLNVNGQTLKRLLVPQNINTGSKPALAAKNGACIAWLIDGTADGGGRWKAKIQTPAGQVIGMAPYGNTTYEVL